MAIAVRINLNDKLFLRDPQDTELGRRIIKHGIELIDEVGIESFTFKKLALKARCTEASVYRYFENKHLLLLYLVSWYWEWVSYLLDFNTNNIGDSSEKLRVAIQTIVSASRYDPSVDFVDESILHRIVISEGTKAYRTKLVDEENAGGMFLTYKALVEKLSDIVLEIHPTFPYPHAFASSMFEMANNHIYFAQHLPKLTDVKVQDDNYNEVETMLAYFAFALLGQGDKND